jgi:hypothetical protein
MIKKGSLLILFYTAVYAAVPFKATLTLVNVTDHPVSFIISRGDLYEASDSGSYVQNAMVTEDVHVTIPAHQTIDVEVPMACIDPDRPMPEPNHQIRPTPFRVPDNLDPDEVHRRLREAADRYRREAL